MFTVAHALCMLPLAVGATAAEAASGPATELLYTLATTGVAVSVGCLAVQLGLVNLDPERREMSALRWYVGRVAFPLLIFRVVASSSVGALQWNQWGVVLSCAVGKLSVMITVWLIAFYCFHHSSIGTSQRLLTATCFMFFVLASDDFAVGFPVVTAIYESELEMDLYVTINALVTNAVFVPIVMILLELGRNMAESAEDAADSDECSGSDSGNGSDTSRESCAPTERANERSALWASLAIAKSIILSPVIVSVVLGVMYSAIFGTFIPVLATKIIDKLTSPFGMLALFATGTVLKRPSLQLWPCLLSLLKVVVCAFVSFVTANFLVGSDQKLADFCFFYGSIPTSSAPLLFTVEYNPGLVDVVASATLFGLCLAGPVMMVTAMFLEQENVSPDILSNAQRVQGGISFLFGIMVNVSVVALGATGRWGFSSRGKTSLAVFGVAECVLAFFTWKSSFMTCSAKGGPNGIFSEVVVMTWLVRWCRWLLVLMQALTVPWPWTYGVSTVFESSAIFAISLVSLASAIAYPGARSVNMDCNYTDSSKEMLLKDLVAIVPVFAVMFGLALFRMQRKTVGRLATGDLGMIEVWRNVPPTAVVKPLVFVELTHLFFAIVNCTVQSADMSLTGSWMSMLMMEGLFQQAQSTFLFGALLMAPTFTEELKGLVEDWTAWSASSVTPLDCEMVVPTVPHPRFRKRTASWADSAPPPDDDDGDGVARERGGG